MEIVVIYIGISQSVFAAILLFFLRPQSIADKILGGWLVAISLMFILNAIKKEVNIIPDLWPVSVNISLTFSPFLYLYSKYVTKEYRKFDLRDLCHFIPLIIGIFIVLIYYPPEIINLRTFTEYYSKLTLPRTITGYLFIFCLWAYTIWTLIRIYIHKKQIENFYSFESTKINLTWLQIVVVCYFVFYHVIIIISAFQIDIDFIDNVEIFRSGGLLIFVYLLSFWGLKQQQLISEDTAIHLNKPKLYKPNDNRYIKSGLKDNRAEEYLKKLVEFMSGAETWKNPELSVAKLSELTGIPKHYITQTLNEYLHKNFYTFINEYRTEYAMKLIASPKYQNWSFLAIAYESGFNSKTAFNIFFKKYTGMTPTEYKNQTYQAE